MKNLKAHTLLAAVSLLSLTACEQLKDAADIKFETSYEETFAVNILVATEPDGSAQFSDNGSIDLTTGEVADYVDKLKNISIKSVQLQVLSYSGPAAAEISGSIDVGGGFALAIPPTNMQDAFNAPQTIDLSDQAGAFNYIKDQLLDLNVLNYSMQGVVSEVPVQAEFKLIYTLDVTANPL